MFYVLNSEGVPVRQELSEDTLLALANEFSNLDSRKVASTRRGPVHVSTIFLTIGEAPFLWETMILGGDLDGTQWRDETLTLSIATHRRAVELAFPTRKPKTEWGTLPGLNPDGTIGPRTVEEVLGRSVWDRLLSDEDLV